MSDYSDPVEEEFEEPRGLRKQIEEQAAARKAAEERAAAAERELAFAKAGLDLNDPKMSYFVKGYDGDPTPEAIRHAAETAGFLSQPEPAPQVPAEELQQHVQAASLSAGAQVTIPDSDAQYQAEIAQARTKDEVLAVMAKYGSPTTLTYQ